MFGGSIGRSHAYAQQMGSKMSKIVNQNQKNFANSNMNDNSLSNGFIMLNRGQTTSVSGAPALMNMKFPTTSHGNRTNSNNMAHR